MSNRIDLKANTSDLTSGLALKLNKADTTTLSNRIDLKANSNNPTFTGTVAGIDKIMVGLGNADNTTDLLKPISNAAQTALDLKANSSDVNTSLSLKIDKVIGKDLSTNDYTTAEKTKLAAISGTNTGDQDLSGLATNTALALKANTTDVTTGLATKVDKVTGKALSTNDYTTAEKSKLAAITGTNTGDQDLSALATNTALALKANTADVNTALNLKANTADVTSAINLKANTSDVNTSLATKVDKVTGKSLSTNDYTTAEKTKLAAITGTNTGDQDLSALATNTALALKANTADVNTALNLKANTADVTSAINLKANTTDVNTSLATKVDKVTGKDLSTNDYTTAEKTKLTAITGTNTGDQDLSALATNTALALKANTTDVTTSLGLKANTTDVNTALNLKANTADVTSAINLKANTTDVNTSLATKVDKVTGKDLSTNDYTTAEKTKLAAITGTNTGDQDLSALATNTALATKANSTDVNTALNLKANTSDVATSLALKASLESPNLSGIPLAPTATPGTNNTQIANTSFVTDAINTAKATNANLTGDVTSIGNSTSIGIAKITNDMLAGSIDLTSKVTGILPAANGGTGVANTGKTITLGGNLTTSGTFSTTITTTNTTNVTLPTTGTLATLAGTETLTNKTLTSPTLTSPALGTPTSINLSNAQGLPLGTGLSTSGVVTGILPYQNGGTGKSTLREAFNSLSPMGRQGDIIYYDGTDAVKLSSGSSVSAAGSFLTLENSTTYPYNPVPRWKSPSDLYNVIKDLVLALPNVKLVSGALSNISNLTTLTSLPNLDFSNITSKLSPTTLANITAVGTLVSGSIPYSLLTGNVPIWNQNTTGSAGSLTTDRSIYGYSFNGTNNLTGVIASQYGGTGNSFTKFTGPTSIEKTFTLPDRDAIILTTNAAVTVAQGGTGLTAAGTDGQVLTSSSGSLTWTTPATISIGAIGTATTNGASIASGVLSLTPADGTNGGIVTTGTQTIAGVKIFTNDAIVNGITVGKGGGNVSNNTAAGADALKSNTTGSYNTAIGTATLFNNTTGASNTAIGFMALNSNTTVDLGGMFPSKGDNNTAIGNRTLQSNTTGSNNTATGNGTLRYNTTGNFNTATGNGTLSSNITGNYNTADGNEALFFNSTGNYNTASGFNALSSNTTGSYNTASGDNALISNTMGSNNTAIGYGADVLSNNLTNATAIGKGAIVSASNTIQLGNRDVTNVKTSGTLTAGSVTYPSSHGTPNQVLSTTGSGTLTWTTPSTTATAYSGTLQVENGGTGAATLTANNVLLGNGTSALQAVAPGTTGNILTSNGTTWTSSAPSGTHTIGESYGGGIVFYVYDNGKHGLIAATSDQSTGIRWYGGSSTDTRARADGVGAGLKNTAIIIANQGAVDGNAFAATVCNEYSVTETVGGITTTYGDWYLPSKYELNLMYNARSTIGGGLEKNDYWSSTETNYATAWFQSNGSSGAFYSLAKNYTGGHVRAIRAF